MSSSTDNRRFWFWFTPALGLALGLGLTVAVSFGAGSDLPAWSWWTLPSLVLAMSGWFAGRHWQNLANRVDDLKTLEESLRAEVAYCQEERDEARQRVHQLESAIRQAESERDQAATDMTALASQLVGKAGETAHQRENVAQAQAKLLQVQNELKQRTNMFERVKSEMEHQILERAQTEERLLESQTRLQLINQLSIRFTSGAPMEEVSARTLREIAVIFYENTVYFGAIGEERYLTISELRQGDHDERVTFQLDLKTAPAYRKRLKLGQPIVVEDLAVDSALSPMQHFFERKRLVSVLEIPIAADERLVGVLGMAATEPRIWKDNEIKTLAEVAQYLALAIKSANIEENRRQAALELLQAKEAAEHATRSKSDFLATMSHEIRTPLNGVLGMTKLLKATRMTPDQAEFAHIIHTSGELLLSLINDILDYSKIEAGKLTLESTTFNPRVLLENTAELLAVKAQEKGLELVVLAPPELPAAIVGDPGRLSQVFINLIGNGIKFTERGEVTLSCQLESLEDGRASLKFAVTDTGIGIPAERIDRLFQSFTQVDASTTRKFGGTGLGLAITKRLVEMMNGTIHVTSTVGTGSSFEIALAFDVAESPPVKDASLVRDLDVVVADCPGSGREALVQTLMSLGCKVHAVADLSAAEQRLDALRPAEGGKRFLILDSNALKDDKALGGLRKRVEGLYVIVVQKLSEYRGSDWAPGDFVVTKPAKQASLRQALVTGLTGEAPTVAATDPLTMSAVVTARRTGKILLVDDHVVNRKLCGHLLRKAGYDFEMAVNGREAIEVFQRQSFSAILMDCRMPEMDGFEATRRIREAEAGSDRVPIIALTASAMDEDRKACLAAGMDDFLPKPIDEYKLYQILERYADGTEAGSIQTQTMPIQPKEPVELWRLRDATDGDPKLMSEMLQLFLDQAARGMTAIQTALSENNAGDLRNAAHALKGACANIGANDMRDAAGQIEELAAADDLGKARRGLDRLMRGYEVVHTHLKQVLRDETVLR